MVTHAYLVHWCVHVVAGKYVSDSVMGKMSCDAFRQCIVLDNSVIDVLAGACSQLACLSEEWEGSFLVIGSFYITLIIS